MRQRPYGVDVHRPANEPGPRDRGGASDAAGRGSATAPVFVPGSHPLLALQRSAGNQATTAFVQRSWIDDVWNRGVFDGSMLAQADPGLPRSLINHYMSAGGAAYDLTRAEMIEVDAFTNVFSWFPAIAAERNRLVAEAEADPAPPTEYRQFTAAISGARGRGGAQKNQTLGNFTITLEGTLTVTKGRTGNLAEFSGTATYSDVWDFDPKPLATFVEGSSGRTTAGELKTWVGALMEGTAFPVNSAATVAVAQHQFDDWASIT